MAICHKVLIKQNSEYVFFPFNPPWPASLVLLATGFALIFLHDFIFKVTYTTLIDLTSIIFAFPLNFI